MRRRTLEDLSAQELALLGPRDLKVPGSPEWCWQTIDLLKNYYQSVDQSWDDLERIKTELEEYRAWERIPPENPYGSLDALLRLELGLTEDQFNRRVIAAKAAERKLNAAQDPDAGHTFEKGKVNQHTMVAQFTQPEGEQTKTQTERAERHGISRRSQQKLDWLSRHRPDLRQRIAAGEMSCNRAWIEAGQAIETVNVPKDPVKAATVIARHFKAEEIQQLVILLSGGAQDGQP